MLFRGIFLNHQVFLMADQTCFHHSFGQSHRLPVCLQSHKQFFAHLEITALLREAR